MEAVECDERVRATTSADELYLDSYERYAGKSVNCCFFFSSIALWLYMID